MILIFSTLSWFPIIVDFRSSRRIFIFPFLRNPSKIRSLLDWWMKKFPRLLENPWGRGGTRWRASGSWMWSLAAFPWRKSRLRCHTIFLDIYMCLYVSSFIFPLMIVFAFIAIIEQVSNLRSGIMMFFISSSFFNFFWSDANFFPRVSLYTDSGSTAGWIWFEDQGVEVGQVVMFFFFKRNCKIEGWKPLFRE